LWFKVSWGKRVNKTLSEKQQNKVKNGSVCKYKPQYCQRERERGEQALRRAPGALAGLEDGRGHMRGNSG
jgi:hypothetical protein